MAEPIEAFVKSMFAEAREELRRQDSGFIATVDAAMRLANGPLQFDARKIKPTKSLPVEWVAVLESCTDVTMQVHALEGSVDALEPEFYEDLDADRAGRLIYHNITSWVHHAWALATKVDVLIAKVCDLPLAPEKTALAVKYKLERTYRNRIETEVKAVMEPTRTPLTHGAGGVGLMARGVTEIGGWERTVAAGILPSFFLDGGYIQDVSNARHWLARRKSHTKGLLARIGTILGDFEQDREAIKA